MSPLAELSARNTVAFVLLCLSFALLIPGLTQPLITIDASFSILGFKKTFLHKTRSIVGTISYLETHGYFFVAALILLFAVAIPLLKSVLLVVALFSKDTARSASIHSFVSSISKWSMADVFAMGVFVAYLSAHATTDFESKLDSGFYYFTMYCLVSLAATQVMEFETPSERHYGSYDRVLEAGIGEDGDGDGDYEAGSYAMKYK